jgi:uncharacterized membrane protein YhaH (DUF805 family)
MFKAPFSFNGRIHRTEYGITFLIRCSVFVFVSVMNSRTETQIWGLVYLPMLWFIWAQGAKRCHDLNKSGWWQIIPFYFFWLLFEKGSPWPNQYDVPGSEVFYGADDYERPFDINEPLQSNAISTTANDIIPPATNE